MLLRAEASLLKQRPLGVALFGQGEMSVDPRAAAVRSSSYPAWWWRLPIDLRFILALAGMVLFFVALFVLPALPMIAEAKDQLRYALRRNDIEIVQLYARGRFCGVYTTGDDWRPMRFLIDNGQVWTGPIGPEGVPQDAPYGSTDPYDQWSRCMSYSKGGRGDEGFALWALGLFH